MNNLTIKKLENISELKELIKVFTLAFESDYKTTDKYLESMIKNSTCLILGAVLDQQLVGGLVAFEMTPIHGTKEYYIYDIAVHPEFQKKGIGKLLMNKIKQEATEREIAIIFVEAESADDEAILFYRAVGGEEVTVNHFNFKI